METTNINRETEHPAIPLTDKTKKNRQTAIEMKDLSQAKKDNSLLADRKLTNSTQNKIRDK